MLRRLRTRRLVALRYDREIDYGSPQHFYHFAWGYLFPALSLVRGRDRPRETYVFEDCGPKMTPLIEEVAKALGLSIQVVERSRLSGAEDLRVPRWDVLCLHRFWADMPESSDHRLAAVRDVIRDRRPEHWALVNGADISGAFQQDVLAFRQWMLDGFCDPETVPWDSFLVLRRSEELPFYGPEGGADIKGYGAARRALSNVDAAVAGLAERGVAASAFECGAHDLAGQAFAFARSRGVAMIRGAEVANLIWARPGTRVYILTPEIMQMVPPPHEGLARLMGLRIKQVLVSGDFPELSAADVAEFWKVGG